MEERELLVRILNVLQMVETKGQSTIYMADTMKAIQDFLNRPEPPRETEEPRNEVFDPES